VLALDPEPVRVVVVLVVRTPALAVCGDSIQVIYSSLAPVDEGRVHGGRE
jgi:hypothetical protein